MVLPCFSLNCYLSCSLLGLDKLGDECGRAVAGARMKLCPRRRALGLCVTESCSPGRKGRPQRWLQLADLSSHLSCSFWGLVEAEAELASSRLMGRAIYFMLK